MYLWQIPIKSVVCGAECTGWMAPLMNILAGKEDHHHTASGVRQGESLSPIVFKLYIDEVIKPTPGMNVRCRLGTIGVNVIASVVDTDWLTR